MKKSIRVLDLEIGKVTLIDEDGALVYLGFEQMEEQGKETELLKDAKLQLKEYLAGKRKSFNLPIKIQGTEFQERVWEALLEIPYGETRSYKDIAIKVGCEQGSRAVGLANNRNPISIIIPCHRVIGANGKLVGYGGGLDIKQRLLKLEKENS